MDMNSKFIFNTHNGIKIKISSIDVNDYPAIKAHLDRYYKNKGETRKGITNNLKTDLYGRFL